MRTNTVHETESSETAISQTWRVHRSTISPEIPATRRPVTSASTTIRRYSDATRRKLTGTKRSHERDSQQWTARMPPLCRRPSSDFRPNTQQQPCLYVQTHRDINSRFCTAAPATATTTAFLICFSAFEFNFYGASGDKLHDAVFPETVGSSSTTDDTIVLSLPDILNMWRKLICVDKQRNNILCEYLP